MMKVYTITISLAIGIAVLLSSCTQQEVSTASNNITRPPLSREAIEQWQDQKYSMFIHFGLYSLPAGVWKDQRVTKGYSEQIRAHGNIPKEEYRALASTFSPVKWNADSVASLAQEAGMKSIVITSKHHDGFAMYHTKYSDFNIVDATPFKRDVIKELSDACHRHNLKFGVYFSLIDWDFPGAVPISDHNSDTIPAHHHQLNLHQVEELMTNYGPISEIWFDMGKPTYQQSKELADLVRTLQPDCLVSGRLWNDQGDFAVMGDNVSPDFRMGMLWQTPASMFDETWGYRSWQERGKVSEKAREKLISLIKVVSNGGNYLLNVGPMGDGSIVPFERDVLLSIGSWLKENGEAIYSTHVTPLPEQRWGVMTEKPGKLFLFILSRPADGVITLQGLRSGIIRAGSLADSSINYKVDFDSENRIHLSNADNDMIDVIVVDYKGELEFVPSNAIRPSNDGTYSLTIDNATKYHSLSGQDYYSTKPTVIKMEWPLIDVEGAEYKMEWQYPSHYMGRSIYLSVNGNETELALNGESSEGQIISLDKTKLNSISIRLAGQANQHEDMKMEGLEIRLKKVK